MCPFYKFLSNQLKILRGKRRRHMPPSIPPYRTSLSAFSYGIVHVLLVPEIVHTHKQLLHRSSQCNKNALFDNIAMS